MITITPTELTSKVSNSINVRPKPMKVLVSAFAASPVRGSEFAVGWEWIQAIAERHQVWVITRESEREEIESYLSAHPSELANVSFRYVPWNEPTNQGIFLHVVYTRRYIQWQKQCLAAARELDAKENFNIIHHINGTGFREPGFLWKLGKPFVWGPILGLQYFRLRFLRLIPIEEAIFLVVKNLAIAWMMRIARRPRQAAYAASRILAGTKQNATMIERLWKRPSLVVSPVTPPAVRHNQPARRNQDEPLRLIWCGRIDAKKALGLLLRALEGLNDGEVKWELLVIGSGQMEDQCRRMAHDQGILERCKFIGQQTRDDTLALMQGGHVFIHSSLYEGAPTTVVEAMSRGLPPVGMDHCGFRDAVDDSCGILIPPTNIDSVIVEFAEAIRKLWRDEESRYKMALAAQATARLLSWEHKKQIVKSIYEDIQRSDHRSN